MNESNPIIEARDDILRELGYWPHEQPINGVTPKRERVPQDAKVYALRRAKQSAAEMLRGLNRFNTQSHQLFARTPFRVQTLKGMSKGKYKQRMKRLEAELEALYGGNVPAGEGGVAADGGGE